MIHDEGSSKQPLFYRRDDHPHGSKWERRHSSVEDSTDVCCRKNGCTLLVWSSIYRQGYKKHVHSRHCLYSVAACSLLNLTCNNVVVLCFLLDI